MLLGIMSKTEVKLFILKNKDMTNQILMITMAALGIGLSIIPGSTMTPGLAKGLTWLVAGIASKFLK
jgi:hypothetical protein